MGGPSQCMRGNKIHRRTSSLAPLPLLLLVFLLLLGVSVGALHGSPHNASSSSEEVAGVSTGPVQEEEEGREDLLGAQLLRDFSRQWAAYRRVPLRLREVDPQSLYTTMWMVHYDDQEEEEDKVRHPHYRKLLPRYLSALTGQRDFDDGAIKEERMMMSPGVTRVREAYNTGEDGMGHRWGVHDAAASMSSTASSSTPRRRSHTSSVSPVSPVRHTKVRRLYELRHQLNPSLYRRHQQGGGKGSNGVDDASGVSSRLALLSAAFDFDAKSSRHRREVISTYTEIFMYELGLIKRDIYDASRELGHAHRVAVQEWGIKAESESRLDQLNELLKDYAAATDHITYTNVTITKTTGRGIALTTKVDVQKQQLELLEATKKLTEKYGKTQEERLAYKAMLDQEKELHTNRAKWANENYLEAKSFIQAESSGLHILAQKFNSKYSEALKDKETRAKMMKKERKGINKRFNDNKSKFSSNNWHKKNSAQMYEHSHNEDLSEFPVEYVTTYRQLCAEYKVRATEYDTFTTASLVEIELLQQKELALVDKRLAHLDAEEVDVSEEAMKAYEQADADAVKEIDQLKEVVKGILEKQQAEFHSIHEHALCNGANPTFDNDGTNTRLDEVATLEAAYALIDQSKEAHDAHLIAIAALRKNELATGADSFTLEGYTQMEKASQAIVKSAEALPIDLRLAVVSAYWATIARTKHKTLHNEFLQMQPAHINSKTDTEITSWLETGEQFYKGITSAINAGKLIGSPSNHVFDAFELLVTDHFSKALEAFSTAYDAIQWVVIPYDRMCKQINPVLQVSGLLYTSLQQQLRDTESMEKDSGRQRSALQQVEDRSQEVYTQWKMIHEWREKGKEDLMDKDFDFLSTTCGQHLPEGEAFSSQAWLALDRIFTERWNKEQKEEDSSSSSSSSRGDSSQTGASDTSSDSSTDSSEDSFVQSSLMSILEASVAGIMNAFGSLTESYSAPDIPLPANFNWNAYMARLRESMSLAGKTQSEFFGKIAEAKNQPGEEMHRLTNELSTMLHEEIQATYLQLLLTAQSKTISMSSAGSGSQSAGGGKKGVWGFVEVHDAANGGELGRAGGEYSLAEYEGTRVSSEGGDLNLISGLEEYRTAVEYIVQQRFDSRLKGLTDTSIGDFTADWGGFLKEVGDISRESLRLVQKLIESEGYRAARKRFTDSAVELNQYATGKQNLLKKKSKKQEEYLKQSAAKDDNETKKRIHLEDYQKKKGIYDSAVVLYGDLERMVNDITSGKALNQQGQEKVERLTREYDQLLGDYNEEVSEMKKLKRLELEQAIGRAEVDLNVQLVEELELKYIKAGNDLKITEQANLISDLHEKLKKTESSSDEDFDPLKIEKEISYENQILRELRSVVFNFDHVTRRIELKQAALDAARNSLEGFEQDLLNLQTHQLRAQTERERFQLKQDSKLQIEKFYLDFKQFPIPKEAELGEETNPAAVSPEEIKISRRDRLLLLSGQEKLHNACTEWLQTVKSRKALLIVLKNEIQLAAQDESYLSAFEDYETNLSGASLSAIQVALKRISRMETNLDKLINLFQTGEHTPDNSEVPDPALELLPDGIFTHGGVFNPTLPDLFKQIMAPDGDPSSYLEEMIKEAFPDVNQINTNQFPSLIRSLSRSVARLCGDPRCIVNLWRSQDQSLTGFLINQPRTSPTPLLVVEEGIQQYLTWLTDGNQLATHLDALIDEGFFRDWRLYDQVDSPMILAALQQSNAYISQNSIQGLSLPHQSAILAALNTHNAIKLAQEQLDQRISAQETEDPSHVYETVLAPGSAALYSSNGGDGEQSSSPSSSFSADQQAIDMRLEELRGGGGGTSSSSPSSSYAVGFMDPHRYFLLMEYYFFDQRIVTDAFAKLLKSDENTALLHVDSSTGTGPSGDNEWMKQRIKTNHRAIIAHMDKQLSLVDNIASLLTQCLADARKDAAVDGEGSPKMRRADSYGEASQPHLTRSNNYLRLKPLVEEWGAGILAEINQAAGLYYLPDYYAEREFTGDDDADAEVQSSALSDYIKQLEFFHAGKLNLLDTYNAPRVVRVVAERTFSVDPMLYMWLSPPKNPQHREKVTYKWPPQTDEYPATYKSAVLIKALVRSYVAGLEEDKMLPKLRTLRASKDRQLETLMGLIYAIPKSFAKMEFLLLESCSESVWTQLQPFLIPTSMQTRALRHVYWPFDEFYESQIVREVEAIAEKEMQAHLDEQERIRLQKEEEERQRLEAERLAREKAERERAAREAWEKLLRDRCSAEAAAVTAEESDITREYERFNRILTSDSPDPTELANVQGLIDKKSTEKFPEWQKALLQDANWMVLRTSYLQGHLDTSFTLSIEEDHTLTALDREAAMQSASDHKSKITDAFTTLVQEVSVYDRLVKQFTSMVPQGVYSGFQKMYTEWFKKEKITKGITFPDAAMDMYDRCFNSSCWVDYFTRIEWMDPSKLLDLTFDYKQIYQNVHTIQSHLQGFRHELEDNYRHLAYVARVNITSATEATVQAIKAYEMALQANGASINSEMDYFVKKDSIALKTGVSKDNPATPQPAITHYYNPRNYHTFYADRLVVEKFEKSAVHPSFLAQSMESKAELIIARLDKHLKAKANALSEAATAATNSDLCKTQVGPNNEGILVNIISECRRLYDRITPQVSSRSAISFPGETSPSQTEWKTKTSAYHTAVQTYQQTIETEFLKIPQTDMQDQSLKKKFLLRVEKMADFESILKELAEEDVSLSGWKALKSSSSVAMALSTVERTRQEMYKLYEDLCQVALDAFLLVQTHRDIVKLCSDVSQPLVELLIPDKLLISSSIPFNIEEASRPAMTARAHLVVDRLKVSVIDSHSADSAQAAKGALDTQLKAAAAERARIAARLEELRVLRETKAAEALNLLQAKVDAETATEKDLDTRVSRSIANKDKIAVSIFERIDNLRNGITTDASNRLMTVDNLQTLLTYSHIYAASTEVQEVIARIRNEVIPIWSDSGSKTKVIMLSEKMKSCARAIDTGFSQTLDAHIPLPKEIIDASKLLLDPQTLRDYYLSLVWMWKMPHSQSYEELGEALASAVMTASGMCGRMEAFYTETFMAEGPLALIGEGAVLASAVAASGMPFVDSDSQADFDRLLDELTKEKPELFPWAKGAVFLPYETIYRHVDMSREEYLLKDIQAKVEYLSAEENGKILSGAGNLLTQLKEELPKLDSCHGVAIDRTEVETTIDTALGFIVSHMDENGTKKQLLEAAKAYQDVVSAMVENWGIHSKAFKELAVGCFTPAAIEELLAAEALLDQGTEWELGSGKLESCVADIKEGLTTVYANLKSKLNAWSDELNVVRIEGDKILSTFFVHIGEVHSCGLMVGGSLGKLYSIAKVPDIVPLLIVDEHVISQLSSLRAQYKESPKSVDSSASSASTTGTIVKTPLANNDQKRLHAQEALLIALNADPVIYKEFQDTRATFTHLQSYEEAGKDVISDAEILSGLISALEGYCLDADSANNDFETSLQVIVGTITQEVARIKGILVKQAPFTMFQQARTNLIADGTLKDLAGLGGRNLEVLAWRDVDLLAWLEPFKLMEWTDGAASDSYEKNNFPTIKEVLMEESKWVNNLRTQRDEDLKRWQTASEAYEAMLWSSRDQVAKALSVYLDAYGKGFAGAQKDCLEFVNGKGLIWEEWLQGMKTPASSSEAFDVSARFNYINYEQYFPRWLVREELLLFRSPDQYKKPFAGRYADMLRRVLNSFMTPIHNTLTALLGELNACGGKMTYRKSISDAVATIDAVLKEMEKDNTQMNAYISQCESHFARLESQCNAELVAIKTDLGQTPTTLAQLSTLCANLCDESVFASQILKGKMGWTDAEVTAFTAAFADMTTPTKAEFLRDTRALVTRFTGHVVTINALTMADMGPLVNEIGTANFLCADVAMPTLPQLFEEETLLHRLVRSLRPAEVHLNCHDWSVYRLYHEPLVASLMATYEQEKAALVPETKTVLQTVDEAVDEAVKTWTNAHPVRRSLDGLTSDIALQTEMSKRNELIMKIYENDAKDRDKNFKVLSNTKAYKHWSEWKTMEEGIKALAGKFSSLKSEYSTGMQGDLYFDSRLSSTLKRQLTSNGIDKDWMDDFIDATTLLPLKKAYLSYQEACTGFYECDTTFYNAKLNGNIQGLLDEYMSSMGMGTWYFGVYSDIKSTIASYHRDLAHLTVPVTEKLLAVNPDYDYLNDPSLANVYKIWHPENDDHAGPSFDYATYDLARYNQYASKLVSQLADYASNQWQDFSVHDRLAHIRQRMAHQLNPEGHFPYGMVTVDESERLSKLQASCGSSSSDTWAIVAPFHGQCTAAVAAMRELAAANGPIASLISAYDTYHTQAYNSLYDESSEAYHNCLSAVEKQQTLTAAKKCATQDCVAAVLIKPLDNGLSAGSLLSSCSLTSLRLMTLKSVLTPAMKSSSVVALKTYQGVVTEKFAAINNYLRSGLETVREKVHEIEYKNGGSFSNTCKETVMEEFLKGVQPDFYFLLVENLEKVVMEEIGGTGGSSRVWP